MESVSVLADNAERATRQGVKADCYVPAEADAGWPCFVYAEHAGPLWRAAVHDWVRTRLHRPLSRRPLWLEASRRAFTRPPPAYTVYLLGE